MFHNKRPVILLLVMIVGSSLVAFMGMFVTASASESSPYESGRDHGWDDAGISDPNNRYLNQPEL
jgi:hypothetical protein